MSLQRSVLISLTVLSLSANILLSLSLLRKSDNGMDHGTVSHFFRSYIDNSAILGSKVIESFLVSHGLQLSSDEMLCLLIPPYPCGACLDSQFLTVAPYLKSRSAAMTLLIPAEWEKDVRVKCNDLSNVDIQVYKVLQEEGDLFSSFESPVFFSSAYGSVRDIFISSAWNNEASILFLNNNE